jgi:hypothetical protein
MVGAMSEPETIRFADFVALRATSLYRYALILARSQREAENLLKESLIRTGLAWREALSTDPEVYAKAVMTRLAALWRTAGQPAADEDPQEPSEVAALADAPTTQAPHDVAETVARGIAVRRTRYRNRGLAVAAGLALVIALAVAVSSLRGEGSPSAAQGSPGAGSPPAASSAPSVPSSPQPAPDAPPPRATLDQLIDRDRAVRLPVQQANGQYFRADALGPSGIVLGGTGFDYAPFRPTDGLVWVIGPEAGRHVVLKPPPPRQPWAHAVGITVAAWAEDAGDRFGLFCADPTSRSPVTREVSRAGVAKSDHPIHADGDVVVWLDDASTVRWVRGCGGLPRSLELPNLLGLSYPEVFYADRGRLHALNLESGHSSEVGVMPGAPPTAGLPFAGNSSFAAWAVGGWLFVLDRRDGLLRRTAMTPQPSPDAHGRLTIGNRLVAYASRVSESEVEFGFVYDIVSGTGMAMPTETFASRDKLLWREGTSYLVAPARPA